MAATAWPVARSADLEGPARAEVVEVRRAVEFGAGIDGVLAEVALDAAHDGVGVGFDLVAVGSELEAADGLDVPRRGSAVATISAACARSRNSAIRRAWLDAFRSVCRRLWRRAGRSACASWRPPCRGHVRHRFRSGAGGTAAAVVAGGCTGGVGGGHAATPALNGMPPKSDGRAQAGHPQGRNAVQDPAQPGCRASTSVRLAGFHSRGRHGRMAFDWKRRRVVNVGRFARRLV